MRVGLLRVEHASARHVRDRQVGGRACRDAVSAGQRKAARGVDAHQRRQPFERDHARLDERSDAGGERALQSRDAHQRPPQAARLFLRRVRGVVGGDHIDRAVRNPLQQRGAVAGAADGRVHLEAAVVLQQLVAEVQIVRRGFAGDVCARPLGAADERDAFRRGDVADVVGGARLFRQRKVALNLRVFARGRNARQPVRAREIAVVDAAAADERDILAVGGKDTSGGFGLAHRPLHHPLVLHAAAVVAERDGVGRVLRQRRDGLAAAPARDAAVGKHPHRRVRRMHGLRAQPLGAVGRRVQVGHRADGGEPAVRRGHRAGPHRLLIRKTRLPQMNMNIRKTGKNSFAAAVQNGDGRGRFDMLGNENNKALVDQNVAVQERAVYVHASALQQHRHSVTPLLSLLYPFYYTCLSGPCQEPFAELFPICGFVQNILTKKQKNGILKQGCNPVREKMYMYSYFIYGYKLISNIVLTNIPIYCAQSYYNGVLYLKFYKDNMESSSWATSLMINENQNAYTLYIGDYVLYRLYPSQNSISVYASDPLYVESTILNLPFAVLAIAKKSLLLHASVFAYEDTLIPIFAKKGTGKTTLAASMSKFYPFFSDDTLYVNPRGDFMRLHAGSRILKMHTDSSSYLGLDSASKQVNIQNKGYYRSFKTVDGTKPAIDYKLGACFFLKREEQQNLTIEQITKPYLKKIYLHANICGAETLGFWYCTQINSCPLFNKIISESNFYTLAIPNDLSRLSAVSEELAKFIANT